MKPNPGLSSAQLSQADADTEIGGGRPERNGTANPFPYHILLPLNLTPFYLFVGSPPHALSLMPHAGKGTITVPHFRFGSVSDYRYGFVFRAFLSRSGEERERELNREGHLLRRPSEQSRVLDHIIPFLYVYGVSHRRPRFY